MTEVDEYVARLTSAIQTIGYVRLMTLPNSTKATIQNTTDLKKKVKILEGIVKKLGTEK